MTNCDSPTQIDFSQTSYFQEALALTANQVQCYQFSTPSSVFVSGTGYTLEGLDPNQNLIASKNNAFLSKSIRKTCINFFLIISNKKLLLYYYVINIKWLYKVYYIYIPVLDKEKSLFIVSSKLWENTKK